MDNEIICAPDEAALKSATDCEEFWSNMKNFDEDYFFIMEELNESLPSLTATEETVERNYSFQPPPPGSSPFFFFNGAREFKERRGIPPTTQMPNILFNGTNLVIRTHLRDALLAMEIPGLFMHPSVYIDEKDHWHEDFWFLIFPKRFDCWDRKKSDYNPDPIRLGGFNLHSIYAYSLDKEKLNDTPLNQRLLFKMGETQEAYTLCHKSLAHIFRDSGTRLITIAGFENA
ncbi:hypothetical protein [Pseudoduganella lurida]|nr:hypothetical protein [Pseudoduganella lurida]